MEHREVEESVHGTQGDGNALANTEKRCDVILTLRRR